MISVSLIRKLEELDPKFKEVLLLLLEEIEKRIAESIKREDFIEFVRKTDENFKKVWEAIHELTEAQKKTEEKLNELIEAQKKTEQKLNELAEAQKKTEERLNKLEEKMIELAEAQRKTEERLNKLEEKMAELAEAQKKTEEELKKLIHEHKKTREQLGGLSHTVGYFLENEAYKKLPALLKSDYGIEITHRLKRDYVKVAPNRYEELNIIGKGKKNGKEIWIMGECKTQLKKKDINEFMRKLSRIKHLFPEDKLFVIVTHQAPPPVQEYAKEKGIKLYFSWQF